MPYLPLQTMSAVSKFRDAARMIGVGNACLFAGSRMLSVLFGSRVRIVKYYFMAQPIPALDGGALTPTGAFDLTWADAYCPLFAQVERPSATIAARFAQGARCLVATAEGTNLAGFLWFVVGPYEEDEVRARFVPKPMGTTAWDFDVTIMPRYRMGRLFSYLWRRAFTELRVDGVSHSLSRISAFNGPSLASHRRLGARHVGTALFLCVGKLQIMRSSTGARPGWHLSWRDDQRPVLAIEV